MKNQIIQKFQSFEILKERAANKDSLFEKFDKTIIFNRFKVFNFRCRSHVQEVSLPKNMFLLYIETHFGIFIFLVVNQNIYTQLCMNVKTHHRHMNYFNLNNSIFLT